MKYLLDTDICVYIISRRREDTAAHFARVRPGDVAISSIALAELAFGAFKSGSPRNQERLQVFISPLTIVSFDSDAAMVYGDLRYTLQRAGTPIGPMDMLIAAQALALDLTLVTNNVREFKRVPALRIENWAAA
jgi:tRNA(fMet)-specific endonuclease VapC